MKIEVSYDQSGYLVTHRTDGRKTPEAVRFSEKADAEDFARLWREWLETPMKESA